MIVALNGYPGVGKFTIGQALATRLDGRLLDIHTVYNVAFAVTEFKTPAFRDTVEQVEAIAHARLLDLPAEVPVVLTTVLAGDTSWGREEWSRIQALGAARPPFCVVHIACDLEENKRRIQSGERYLKRKPRDAAMAERNHLDAKPLLGLDAEHLLCLDATDLSAEAAARAIADWTDAQRA